MYKIYMYLLLISLNVMLCYCDESAVDDTELVMTFLVHRHGDRTPVESTLSYSSEKEALISASAKYGYGQLTDVGKNRSYELGQYIRRRYDSLLSSYYNRSEIYIRSTDSTRAKMTVLAAMAAVYPASEDNWSDSIGWTPVPYTTFPAKFDYNLFSLNCPAFSSTYTSRMMSTPSSMAAYSDVLDEWSSYTGFNLTAYPVLSYVINDVYTSQVSLGIPLEPEVEAIYPEIEKVAGVAMDVIFGDESLIPLQGGVLLNEFFTVADQVISGDATQKVYIYSAHDVNVYSFEAVTRITPRQGVPKYASAYALELRKVVDTEEYVVVPVYLNTPSEDEILYLEVDGCGELCVYENFRTLTSAYVLDEDEWRTQCNFDINADYDTSSID